MIVKLQVSSKARPNARLLDHQQKQKKIITTIYMNKTKKPML